MVAGREGEGRGEGAGDGEPVEWLSLDDEFVRGAPVREASAHERLERLRHIDAEHRRLLDERRAQLEKIQRKDRRRRRRPRRVLFVVVAGIAVLIGWSVFLDDGGGSGAGDLAVEAEAADADDAVETTETTAASTTTTAVRRFPGWPLPSTEQQAAPLGAPAPLETESASYTFIEVQRSTDDPVAYDPCRPIHVVHNLHGAPADAPDLLAEALADVSVATGLQFVLDGETDEIPDMVSREPFQLDRYGDRWAPVLIAWADETTMPDLAGDFAGVGGSMWVEVGSARVYVTGVVVLDAPDLARAVDYEGSRAAVGVIRHELAHVVGLGHVDDPAELMYAETAPGVFDFGPGDLTGLAHLGRGRCFPNLL